MRVGNLAVQYLADNSQDIDCRNDDTCTSNYRSRTVERVIISERADKDCHLGNET